MSLKERVIKEFKEKIDSDEEIREFILIYYECESGFLGFVGVLNGNFVFIWGVLVYIEKSLFFYGEVFFNLFIVLYILFNKIREIKIGK